MAKDAPIAFRIEGRVKAALLRAAAADRRSLSSLIDKALVEWLGANGFEIEQPKRKAAAMPRKRRS